MQKFWAVTLMLTICFHFLFAQESVPGKAQESVPGKGYLVESISMKDCLLRAVENNLDLESEGYNPKIKEFDLTYARSEFDPFFTTSSTFAGSREDPDDRNRSELQIGIQKKHLLGGTVGLFYEMEYNKQETQDSRWQQGVYFSITQPLLRNLGIATNQASVYLAQNSLDQSFYDFENQVITVLANVQIAYWNLVNARASYELRRKSMELTENLYKITLARIKAGSLAAADILDVERNLASKRDSLIVAEKDVYDAEDNLKKLIKPLDLNYYKNVRLIPTELPVLHRIQINFEECLKYALEHRPDIESARLSIKNAGINADTYKNRLLPKLDLSAIVGLVGESGKSIEAWDHLADADYPYWQLRLSLEVPLGNRGARSRYEKALLEKRQVLVRYKTVENQIITDVRSTIREVETSVLHVETAQLTRELAEKQLANEENKFRAGIITLFQVQDTEQKLTEASITESNALLDLQRALVRMERAKGSLLQSIRKYDVNFDFKKKR